MVFLLFAKCTQFFPNTFHLNILNSGVEIRLNSLFTCHASPLEIIGRANDFYRSIIKPNF